MAGRFSLGPVFLNGGYDPTFRFTSAFQKLWFTDTVFAARVNRFTPLAPILSSGFEPPPLDSPLLLKVMIYGIGLPG